MSYEEIAIYLSVALAMSEGLALLPALQSNGVLDMIIKVLKAVVKK